jgi:phosphoglycerate dehydrogenase-like enzyme
MESQSRDALVIGFAAPVEPSLVEKLSLLPGVRVEEHRALEGAALNELAGRVSILVTRSWQRIDARLIEAAAGRGLRAIVQGSAGRDNIDLGAASRAGVRVLFPDPGNATAVAELTLLSLLIFFRGARTRWVESTQGVWPDREAVQDREVRAKTLGIVGLGRVGSRVARRAAAFEMRVLAVDPYLPDHAFREAGAIRVATLEELLPRCDALSLHCPLNEETRALVDDARLRLLPPGAFVLNTARGGVLVEKDLRAALDAGLVAGAMLDVFEQEPFEPGGLHEHPGVLATPHIAGHTLESHAQRENELFDALAGLATELGAGRVG